MAKKVTAPSRNQQYPSREGGYGVARGGGHRNAGGNFSPGRRDSLPRGSARPELTRTYPSGYRNIFPTTVQDRLSFTSHERFPSGQYEYICSPRQVRRKLLPILERSEFTVYDAETCKKDTGRPTTETLDCEALLTQYLPLVEGWRDEPVYIVRGNDAARELRDWFASPWHKKIGHNLGFDRWVALEGLKVPFAGYFADTMLMFWSLDTERGEGKEMGELNLENLLVENYGIAYPHFGEVWGEHKEGNKRVFPDMRHVLEVPGSSFYNRTGALDYAAKDVWEDAWLYEDLKRILTHEGLWPLMVEVEFPFLLSLEEMEARGITLDPVILREIQGECHKKYVRLKHRWRHQVGSIHANPSSSASSQRQHIFFQHGEFEQKGGPFSKPGPHRFMECGCRVPHKYNPKNSAHMTPAGNPSCDTSAMERLAAEGCPAASLLVQIGSDEEVLKFANGFLKGLTRQETQEGNEFFTCHPSWWGMLKTTRTSASSNRYGTGRTLQNIPKNPDKDPYKIRRAFVARPGYALIGCDYGQLELRILAWLTQDPTMIETFRVGGDPHSMMAVAVFDLDCPWQEVKDKYPTERDGVKCFHPETEVLTKRGWVLISELQEGEQVIQAIPRDGVEVDLEWVVPEAVFSQRNEHTHLLHLQNEGMDLRVTPDHDMLVWPSGKTFKKVPASEFGSQRYWANAGTLRGGIDEDARLLRLAVAVQADGSLVNKGKDAIRFGFTKERKIERLRDLLTGIPHSERTSANGVTHFSVAPSAAAPILALLDDKSLPWRWLSLSEESRAVVLEEARYWDSCQMSAWTMYRYSSTDTQSLDVLQALASLTNRKTRMVSRPPVKEGHAPQHNLSVRGTNRSRGETLRKEQIPYTGDVVCLKVPSTFVLVRDAVGKVPAIVGNCINYGIPYGLTEHGLAQQLKSTKQHARRLMDMWFAAAPRARDYIHSCHNFAREHGFIQGIYGRRRYLPTMYACRLAGRYAAAPEDARGKLAHEYNVASNDPIQRMAGMLMRRAQRDFDNDPRKKELDLHLVAQIHDEILVEVPLRHAEEGAHLVQKHMEGAKHHVLQMAYGPDYPRLEPDFPADPAIGFSWADTK